MSEIHALTGAYALDALDDIERAQFERHLAECATCRSEVLELRETAAVLTQDAMAQPPVTLRDRVLADIATVRPLPPRVNQTADDIQPDAATNQEVDHRAPRRTRWTSLVAAAAAAVALGVGGTIVWNQMDQDSSQTVLATDKVLQATDAESATADLPDGGEATVVRSEELGEAVLITDGLPAAPAGMAYQMWLLTDDLPPSSAGMLSASANQTVLLEGDAATATAAAITVEPTGGSNQPTSEPIALIDFSNLEPA